MWSGTLIGPVSVLKQPLIIEGAAYVNPIAV